MVSFYISTLHHHLRRCVLQRLRQKGGFSCSDCTPSSGQITYRRGTSDIPVPFVRGTGIRVQTIIIARTVWESSLSEIAENYALTEKQVQEVLDFYSAHQQEIDLAIAHEQTLEANRV